MKITYRLSSDTSVILGTETKSGIDEVIFPDINYFSNHPITITKKFSHSSSYRWVVRSVQHPSKTEIIIDLDERRPPIKEVYLSQTYAKNTNVISNLQKGVLVEVEYGYISAIKKLDGKIRSTKRYPDFKQQGEMHKRRLAIVINATSNFIQVVPITSKVPVSLGDKSIFEISYDSLKDLTDYNHPSKRAFALAGMIQTVSTNRILPPISRSKSHRNTVPERAFGYPHKLTKLDNSKLDSALSIAVRLSDYNQIKSDLNDEFRKNRENNLRIESLNNIIENKNAQLSKFMGERERYDAIMAVIEDHYLLLHPHKNLAQVRELIEAEISENIAAVQG